MKNAKRLIETRVWFYGPQAPDLFYASHTDPPGFDHVVIGTGGSKAMAASRALSYLRDLQVLPVLGDIVDKVQASLPLNGGDIEAADPALDIFCVLAINIEREA